MAVEPEPIAEMNVELKDPGLAVFLAWLVPGLGHFYQGRIAKAILFFVCILGTFVYGVWLGGRSDLGYGRAVYLSFRTGDTRLRRTSLGGSRRGRAVHDDDFVLLNDVLDVLLIEAVGFEQLRDGVDLLRLGFELRLQLRLRVHALARVREFDAALGGIGGCPPGGVGRGRP